MHTLSCSPIAVAALWLCAGTLLPSCAPAAKSPDTAAARDFATLYEGLPFDMPAVSLPTIPDYTVSLVDFGGVGDGVTLNTEAFAAAMSHLAERGGGRIVVPAGAWRTGPIGFASHVEMHLADGALVLFSDRRADYPLVESNFEGRATRRCMSPLSASGRTDIAITGRGVFDASGGAWRPVKRGKMTDGQWRDLCRTGVVGTRGDVWYPSERIREVAEEGGRIYAAFDGQPDSLFAYIHDYLRPALLSFIGCERVLLEDVTFQNSPGWNLHPLMCQDLVLNRVTILNPWYAQNGDGLDLESCRRVIVNGCTLDVGDDALCIKSGKDKEGRDRAMPTEDVIIAGCVVRHGHGGFVIGSEMSGGARRISVRDCIFTSTDTGLRFKSTRGRGGVVEDIHIDGVRMAHIAGDAIVFDLYYGGKPGGDVPPVSEATPSFRDIHIANVVCQGARRAMFLNGLPEMPVRDVTLRHSTFHAATGAVLNAVDGLTLDGVTILPDAGDPIVQTDVTRLTVR